MHLNLATFALTLSLILSTACARPIIDGSANGAAAAVEELAPAEQIGAAVPDSAVAGMIEPPLPVAAPAAEGDLVIVQGINSESNSNALNIHNVREASHIVSTSNDDSLISEAKTVVFDFTTPDLEWKIVTIMKSLSQPVKVAVQAIWNIVEDAIHSTDELTRAMKMILPKAKKVETIKILTTYARGSHSADITRGLATGALENLRYFSLSRPVVGAGSNFGSNMDYTMNLNIAELLRSAPQLESLHLNAYYFARQRDSNFPVHPSLQSLAIAFWNDWHLYGLKMIQSMPHLTSLILQGTVLSNADFKSLNPGLQVLRLGPASGASIDLPRIALDSAKLSSLTQLRQLTLGQYYSIDLTMLSTLSALETLDLSITGEIDIATITEVLRDLSQLPRLSRMLLHLAPRVKRRAQDAGPAAAAGINEHHFDVDDDDVEEEDFMGLDEREPLHSLRMICQQRHMSLSIQTHYLDSVTHLELPEAPLVSSHFGPYIEAMSNMFE